MTAKVFIDGEVGTTGLQIRTRLEARPDITLISLPEADRKSRSARLDAFAEADAAIVCLPDAAVLEIAADLAKLDTKIIDASTAHRIDPDWEFGFAELDADAQARIAAAKRVSNPGCYSTGAIALLKPLIDAGLLPPDTPISINAVSGYSGGGKALIAEFEDQGRDGVFVYATGQSHKHLPEIVTRAGLTRRPIFVPMVGDYAQGMIVQIPFHGPPGFAQQALAAYEAHYRDQHFVCAVPRASMGERIDPRRLNDTNRMELTVDGDPDTGATVLIAVLDNLGKGASGAAVQNLNIMLGRDPALGL